MKSSKFLVAVAAALIAQAASAAATVTQPSIVIYGGGATLPADAYVGDSWLDAVPSRRLSNTLPPPAGSKSNDNAASAGSLFTAYSLSTAAGSQSAGTVGVSYCQTGSGTGRGVITNKVNGSGLCGDYSGTPTGFAATTRRADFGASDAPLSQGDINNFYASNNDPLKSTDNTTAQNYGTLYTQPVQIPAVAGSIAIVYNNADLGKVQLNLTRADICGIFSGQITDWAALSSHTPKLKQGLKSKTIKVVVRSDSSGTTFSFSNFLSQACPAVGIGSGSTRFVTANTFIGSGSSSAAFTIAGVTGASGNGNVVNTVASTDGAIGYAEVADAVSRNKRAGGSNLQFATVSYAADVTKTTGTIAVGGADVTCADGTVISNAGGTKPKKYTCAALTYNKLDPAKNFLAKGATGIAVNTTTDSVLNGIDTNGRPVVQAAASLSGTTGCLLIVPPNAYAESPVGATKTAPADYAIYPIKAVSYLLAYGTGNSNGNASATPAVADTRTPAIKGLLKAPFSSTVLAKVKTIGKTTGFAPLSVSVNGVAQDMSAFVENCVRQ